MYATKDAFKRHPKHKILLENSLLNHLDHLQVAEESTVFRPADINELIRIQRYSAAVFRLSFRDSDKMHYEESERKVVTAFLKRSIEVAQSNVEKGLLPAKALADELARIQKWKRDRERQEL